MVFKYKVAPLTGGFMITSIAGFLISTFYIYGASQKWGFTFGLFFVLMFIASLISMTYGPDTAQYDIAHKRKNFVSPVKKKK
jgi:hypothetical protein